MNNKKIKCLIMDVDGTLTDGKIYIGNDGEMFKAFDIKDGCGIHDILIPSGIVPIIITGRFSKMLEYRCKELGITELYQAIQNKVEKMSTILSTIKCNYENVAYIGDDINDLPCMNIIKRYGGLIGCPSDAVEQVKEISNFISKKKGGSGAVREFIEWIINE